MSAWHLLLGKRFRLYSYSSGLTWAFAHFPRWLKTAGTGALFGRRGQSLRTGG